MSPLNQIDKTNRISKVYCLVWISKECILDRYLDKVANKTNTEEMNKKLEQEIVSFELI